MKIKSLLGIVALCSVVVLGSCGKSDEEKVKDFSVDFARKASNNQLDSLEIMYPCVTSADSVALKYVEDGIVVRPMDSENEFEVVLNPDVTLKVVKNADGSLKVQESHGLFAYPADVIALVRESGLWDDHATDEELASHVKTALKRREAELEAREAEKFANSLPQVSRMWYDWEGSDNVARYLRSLGFQGVSHENSWDSYVGGYSGTFTLNMGKRECIVTYCCEEHSSSVKITINGDDDVLERYYQKARQNVYSGYEEGCTVTLNGNTISVESYGA